MPRKAKSPAAKAKSRATNEASSKSAGKIRIQYYRSFIATPKTHKQMVRSLGLTKLNQIVERPDNASMRGAVAKIPHLLRIVE
jgi:large subunit ribosomal protein L30